MAQKTVTMKATMKRGTFYWVAQVDAASDEEAIVVAENLFQAEMEAGEEWVFDDFEIDGDGDGDG